MSLIKILLVIGSVLNASLLFAQENKLFLDDTFIQTAITDKVTKKSNDSLESFHDKHGFSFFDKKVVWVGEVKPLVRVTGLNAKWINPSGEVFKETKLKKIIKNVYVAEMPIQGAVAEPLKGKWHIKILDANGEELAKSHFFIGQVDIKDVENETAKWKDKSFDINKEDAVILFNERDVKVDDNFANVDRIHKRIKINTDKAKDLAEVYIPFFIGLEEIYIDYAYTITPDGEVINSTQQQIITLAQDSPNYSSSKLFVMAMPGVVEGSIIDYQIRIVSSKPKAEKMFWDDYAYKQKYPVIRSRFSIDYPAQLELKYQSFNQDLKPIRDIKEGVSNYIEFNQQDIRPVVMEEMMPTAREMIPYVVISNIDSWEKIGKWWYSLIKDKTQLNEVERELVSKIIATAKYDEEKAEAIYRYITKNVRYVGLTFGSTMYEPFKAQDVLKNKYGDCKDQSMLLLSMLQVAGIKANSALVRTVDIGDLQKKQPSIGEFNHAIVVAEINGKKYFLDPTVSRYPFNVVPFTLEHAEVLLVKDDGVEFVTIPNSLFTDNQTSIKTQLNLKDDLSIEGVLKIRWFGQNAGNMREAVFKLKKEEKDKFVEATLRQFYSHGVVSKYEFEKENQYNVPLELNIVFKMNNWLNQINNNAWTLNLLGDGVLVVPTYLNSSRKNPIRNFKSETHKMEITLNLPSRFKIKNVPQDYKGWTTYFASNIKNQNLNNHFIQQQEINFKASVVGLGQVEEFQKSWEKFIQHVRQPIVLEKL